MHHSIITCDGKPAVERCTTCCSQFHCPLCPKGMFKPSQPAKLQRHLEVHIKMLLHFKVMPLYFRLKIHMCVYTHTHTYMWTCACVHVTFLSLSNINIFYLLLDKICRCNLNCRNGGHYHCPFCDKTVVRTDMQAHLKSCPIQPSSTSAAAQSKQSQDSSLPSLQPSPSAASIPLLPPTIISPSPDLLVQQDTIACTIPSAQSIQTSTIHSSADTHMTLSSLLVSSSVVHTTQETQGPKSKLKQVQYPLCSVTCLKRNLAKHIQRKHPKKPKDVTESDNLKSVCVDAKNGISAVQKGGHGFSIPYMYRTKPGVEYTRFSVSWKNAGSIPKWHHEVD